MQLLLEKVILLCVATFVSAMVGDEKDYPGSELNLNIKGFSNTPKPISDTTIITNVNKFFEQCVKKTSNLSAEEPDINLIPASALYVQFVASISKGQLESKVSYIILPTKTERVSKDLLASSQLHLNPLYDSKNYGEGVAKESVVEVFQVQLSRIVVAGGTFDSTLMLYNGDTYKLGENEEILFYHFAVIWTSSNGNVYIDNANDLADWIEGGWINFGKGLLARLGSLVSVAQNTIGNLMHKIYSYGSSGTGEGST